MSERRVHPEAIDKASAAVSSRENGVSLEKQLREGFYTNTILEGYARENVWSREIVAREILQNFFDANGFTLDGIQIDVEGRGEEIEVTVRGDQTYHWRRLVSYGSGHKEEAHKAAGGKHQGTKDVVVMLMREYGCNDVEYASDDWKLTFYQNDLPKELVDDDVREKQHGVYVKLADQEQEPGNILRFKTRDRAMAEALVKARDLFYHSGNHDFVSPDIDTDKAGFKMLDSGESGNFYLNGQRVAYEQRGKWNTVPGFTFWSKETPQSGGNKIVLSRDRDILLPFEVKYTFVPFLVGSMPHEEQELALSVLDKYCLSSSLEGPGRWIVESLVEALSRRGYTQKFPEHCLADDLDVESGKKEALENSGCRLYLGCFSKIGMPRASETFDTLASEYERKPVEGESRRISLAMDVAEKFLKMFGTELGIEAKQIKLFESTSPILGGQYDDGQVWISRRVLGTDTPYSFLATYLHELSHKFGDDSSHAFSSKLTDVLETWTQYIIFHPMDMVKLVVEWAKIQIDRNWHSVEEFEDTVRGFIQRTRSEGTDFYDKDLNDFDIEINRLSGSLLDLLADMPGGATAENCLRIKDKIEENPKVLKFRRFTQALDIPEDERNKIEERIREIDLEIGRVFKEINVTEQKIKKVRAGKIKRGRMRLLKEYEAHLGTVDVKYKELREESDNLRRQLPGYLDISRLEDTFEIGGSVFSLASVIETERFYIACARVLHSDVTPSASQQETEDKFKEIKEMIDASLTQMKKRGNYLRRFMAKEIELTLRMTKSDPSPTNLRFGQMLFESTTDSLDRAKRSSGNL